MSQADYLKIYDELADDVFRYFHLRISDREKAKELLQESFARVWEVIKYKHIWKSNIHAALYKKANELIEKCKKEKIYRLTVYSQRGFISLL